MNKPVVMIVDDEPHVIRVLRLVLERAGYQVTSANDGHAALAAMVARRPDLLVSDIQMPGMDGRELYQAVRARYPDEPFPILVMSSMTAESARTWTGRLPNVEFLEKPVSPRQVLARAAACAPVAPDQTPCVPTS